jgi:hypothetical protein
MKTLRFPFFLLLAVLPLSILSGCQFLGEPKVPAPAGLPVPEGTPITLGQFEKQIEAARVKEEAAQKADERKATRIINQLEREAKTASETAIASAQDKAEELIEDLQVKADGRMAALKGLQVSLEQAREDIAARQSFIEGALGLAGTAANNSGIPGLGAIIGPALGLLGVAFGVKRGGDAKAEREASRAHDDAWEEGRKELLATIAMHIGRNNSPTT